MLSGRCRGGPLNTKMLHHPEPVYRVAVDAKDPLRIYVGQVAPSTFAPEIRFGSYFHNIVTGEWDWHDMGKIVSSQRPETAEAVGNSKAAKQP